MTTAINADLTVEKSWNDSLPKVFMYIIVAL